MIRFPMSSRTTLLCAIVASLVFVVFSIPTASAQTGGRPALKWFCTGNCYSSMWDDVYESYLEGCQEFARVGNIGLTFIEFRGSTVPEFNPDNSIKQHAGGQCFYRFSTGTTTPGASIWTIGYCGEKQTSGPCGCPSGQTLIGTHCIGDHGKNIGEPKWCAGNPINTRTGNKFQRELDYAGAAQSNPLVFERYYNSSTYMNADILGPRWRHRYSSSILIPAAASTTVEAERPDGRRYEFRFAAGAWQPDPDVMDRLTELKDPQGARTGWQYRVAAAEELESYDSTGRLVSVTDRAGVKQTLTYSDSTAPNGVAPRSGLLIGVADDIGRQLTFTYNAAGRLATMSDPNKGAYRYDYDNGTNNLHSVTYPGERQRVYHYNEAIYTGNTNLPHALTGITDENGKRYASFRYEASGRAIGSEHAGGAEAITLVFNADGTTTLTEALGATPRLGFQTIHGVPQLTSKDRPGVSCGSWQSAAYHGITGQMKSRTDWNGFVTTFLREDAERTDLETSRTEGLGANGSARSETRTTTTSWDTRFRLPTQIEVYAGATATGTPKRRSTFVYDDHGHVTRRTIEDIAAKKTRTWTYVYTYSSVAPGVIEQLVVDGPRTDVADITTYEYWPADASCRVSLPGASPIGCRGQLKQITNAAEHPTRFDEYNAHGQPLKIIDPNETETRLTYDARMRLTSRTVGSEATTYQYDGVGQLDLLTLPDKSYIDYDYDDAHRLTDIRDNLKNHIHYELDLMGNRRVEEVRDPTEALKAKHNREYDALNRLFHDIGGTDPAKQVTEYGYDPQGNRKTLDGPMTGVPSLR